jgi:alpha-glucuronidase
MKTRRTRELHPAGEGDFGFATYGGAVRLSATDDGLTPFGGLVPWAAFVGRCGLFETLSASAPVVRTSPQRGAGL